MNGHAQLEKVSILLRSALGSQYHSCLEMLRQGIEMCPENLWNPAGQVNPAWQVAYHALFFTHLYLQPTADDFQPWEHHREDYQFLDHKPPDGDFYTREQILQYLVICDEMVDKAVEMIDLYAGESGFHWYRVPKIEHQMISLRHIQHHAAQLADRIRAAENRGIRWVGAHRG